jgi:membrane-bound lytic murein transglycosylase D
MESTGGRTFWELLDLSAIPRETRGYVPTFYATLLIAGDPNTYGFRLGTEEAVDDARVIVEGPLSLSHVAEVAGVSRESLRELNPALRRGLLPPGRTSIHVPARAVQTVASRATTMKNDDATIAVCSFTLREGDTLKRLARAIGVRADTLVAMNGLRSVHAVSEGDSIYLPVRARELGTLLAGVYYKVRKGDTFFSIAKKHGITVAELRELNDLSRRAKPHAGQRLRVLPPRSVTAGGM